MSWKGGAMVDLRPYAAKLIRPAALAPKRIMTPRICSSCSCYIVRASSHTTQAKARSRVPRSVMEANKLISAPVARSHLFQEKVTLASSRLVLSPLSWETIGKTRRCSIQQPHPACNGFVQAALIQYNYHHIVTQEFECSIHHTDASTLSLANLF